MIFIKEKGKGLLVCFGIAAAALLLGAMDSHYRRAGICHPHWNAAGISH